MSDSANSAPENEPVVSEFMRATGLVITVRTPTLMSGYVDLGPEHHQPHGIVHGGVFCAIIESVASVGGYEAVADQGKLVVGVHNATDFLRPGTAGRASVHGEPIFQGRTQQLWQVIITDEASGKDLARGQVRLANIDPPTKR